MIQSTTITNATNGAIVTITTIHHSRMGAPQAVMLGILATGLIVAGLYLLFRKEKPR